MASMAQNFQIFTNQDIERLLFDINAKLRGTGSLFIKYVFFY